MAPTKEQSKASKAKQLTGGKTVKARVARYLKTTEPTIVEGAKSTLLLKGMRCSEGMGHVLKDLRAVLQPHCKMLTKKNAIVAFDSVEGQQSLEFLSTKNDCSLFCMASHNKKRPNNLIIGRLFDRTMLDMIELGVKRYKSLQDYGGSVPKKRVGSKPCMLFVGDLWEQSSETIKLQNLLIDLYKGDPVEKLVVSGLDHIMVFTMVQGPNDKPLVHQRTYHMKLKKNPNNSNIPVPFLLPCGPDMDFEIRRSQLAEPELWRAALKQPKSTHTKKRKIKNLSTNIFGETVGRLHLERQDIAKSIGRKSKALRRAEKAEADEEKAALEAELASEKESMGAEFRQQFGFEEEETESRRFKKIKK